jgi:precorrin-6B methylase 2
MTGAEIARALGLAPRAVPDFPDALLALGLLARDGEGPQARYSNTPDTATFLDPASPAYMGGILEMANARLWGFWGSLTEALRTGLPQNETKHSNEGMFQALYAEPARLEQFLRAMEGVSAGNFQAFAARFDFSRYRTLADIGGATGQLACAVAAAQPHMACTTFDLPKVTAIARRRIAERGQGGQVGTERVEAVAGDFFADALPRADVITMGMVLHDWSLEKKKALIAKAYEALPEGGAFVAIEALIDDARRENAFGLLMSLNMMIEFGSEAFDYSGADFAGWCREAGFRRFEVIPLAGPSSAAVAYK